MLSPEHSARLGRIAAAEGKTVSEVIDDIIQVAWVRWALERRLPPGDW